MRYRFTFSFGNERREWETAAVDEAEAFGLAMDEAQRQANDYGVSLHLSGQLEDLVAVHHWLNDNPTKVELNGSWDA